MYEGVDREMVDLMMIVVKENLPDVAFIIHDDSRLKTPKDAYVPQRRNLYCGAFLNQLQQLEQPNAIATIGVTDQDIFVGGLKSIFGCSNPEQKAAAVTTLKVHEPGADDAIMQPRRLAKIMLHELGHLFGFDHCLDIEDCCVMVTNSRIDGLDATPVNYCELQKTMIRQRLIDIGALDEPGSAETDEDK